MTPTPPTLALPIIVGRYESYGRNRSNNSLLDEQWREIYHQVRPEWTDIGVRPDGFETDAVYTDELSATSYLETKRTRPIAELKQMSFGAMTHNRDVGTIALETNDAETETYMQTHQNMMERGLPWSIAVPVSVVGDATHCTWSELVEMYSYGAEICVHPNTTGDVTASDKQTVLERVLDYKDELESRGFDCQRLVTTGDPDFVDRSSFETFGGRIIMGGLIQSVGSSEIGLEILPVRVGVYSAAGLPTNAIKSVIGHNQLSRILLTACLRQRER